MEQTDNKEIFPSMENATFNVTRTRKTVEQSTCEIVELRNLIESINADLVVLSDKSNQLRTMLREHNVTVPNESPTPHFSKDMLIEPFNATTLSTTKTSASSILKRIRALMNKMKKVALACKRLFVCCCSTTEVSKDGVEKDELVEQLVSAQLKLSMVLKDHSILMKEAAKLRATFA